MLPLVMALTVWSLPCAARQVPTDPELSFEQPLVQEAMQAVLDFEGYSMLGVVPEEE